MSSPFVPFSHPGDSLLSMYGPPWSGFCGEPGALMEPLIQLTRLGLVLLMTDCWYMSPTVQPSAMPKWTGRSSRL